MTALQKSETSSLERLDELCEIRDALKVVWCALTNGNHASEQLGPIGNHVNDLANRLGDCQEAITANWRAGDTSPPASAPATGGRVKGEVPDALLDAKCDFGHLRTLIEVITDMAVDMPLSAVAAPADHALLETLRSMLWIARDLVTRTVGDLERASAAMMKGGEAP